MEKITGIAIVNGKASVVELEDNLEAYYELLGCNMIEIATRQIGKHVYDIVCDEEGTLKGYNHIAAINKKREPMLVGNIFICRSFDGDLISLDPNDILHIGKRMHRKKQVDKDTGEIRTFNVVECDYVQYVPTDMDTAVIEAIEAGEE